MRLDYDNGEIVEITYIKIAENIKGYKTVVAFAGIKGYTI